MRAPQEDVASDGSGDREQTGIQEQCQPRTQPVQRPSIDCPLEEQLFADGCQYACTPDAEQCADWPDQPKTSTVGSDEVLLVSKHAVLIPETELEIHIA